MKSRPALSSNFAPLQSHDEQLLRLGMLAERYFADDPNTCLLKLRQLSEVHAQLVASSIIGYIRQAALGDPLIPFALRVDSALQSMLASRAWTTPQRDWLKKIAAQTKANQLVDRASLDEDHLIFKREGGGFPRLNKLFDGQLAQVLSLFNDTVWQQGA